MAGIANWRDITTFEELNQLHRDLEAAESDSKRQVMADMAKTLYEAGGWGSKAWTSPGKPFVGRKRPRKPRRR